MKHCLTVFLFFSLLISVTQNARSATAPKIKGHIKGIPEAVTRVETGADGCEESCSLVYILESASTSMLCSTAPDAAGNVACILESSGRSLLPAAPSCDSYDAAVNLDLPYDWNGAHIESSGAWVYNNSSLDTGTATSQDVRTLTVCIKTSTVVAP